MFLFDECFVCDGSGSEENWHFSEKSLNAVFGLDSVSGSGGVSVSFFISFSRQ
jgi:hypothetical protein